MNSETKNKGAKKMTREEKAERIEEILNSNDYKARIWEGGQHIRVYVKRTLSRGRTQDMGFIAILEDDSLDFALTRSRAGIRDLVNSNL